MRTQFSCTIRHAIITALLGFTLLPAELPAGGAECDYVSCSGAWYEPWKCEWVTCPSNQTCEWLASPRKCRHQPPWEDEPCTIFSGTLDDPLNFCGSEDNYCRGFTDGLAGTCTPYKKVGDGCNGVHTLCANPLGNTGRMCRPAYYFVDNPAYMQCYPNFTTFDLSSDADCMAAYSKSVHQELMENYEETDGNSIYNMTLSYSAGRGVAAYAGMTEEVGVVYSGDGIYACYSSTCQGLGSSVGGEYFVSQTSYDNDYEAFLAGDRLVDFSADTLVAGLSYATVLSNSNDKVGDMVTFWAGIAVPGMGADFVQCDPPDIMYEYAWNPDTGILEATTPRLQCRNASECADAQSCIAEVSISAQPGHEPVPVEQAPAGPYGIGSREVTLQSVLADEAVSCTALAEVVDCTPPDIDCQDILAECTSSAGAFVSPVNPPYTDCSAVEFDLPDAGTYPIGENEVFYIGTDADNNQAVCRSFITVVDSTGPDISLQASPDVLWPPNNKMVEVVIGVEVEDQCDPDPVCEIVAVSSNEEERKREIDWLIHDDLTVELRAQRDGKGIDRHYDVTVECGDAHGNSSQSTVTVTVPHDQGDA